MQATKPERRPPSHQARQVARNFHALLLIVSCLFLATTVNAQTHADAITGYWLTTDEEGNQDSIVEISRQGQQFEGHVRWLRYATYPDGDRMQGLSIVDRENPHVGLRNTPVLGMRVLWGLVFDGERWSDGHTYSVRKGKKYRARISLVSPNTIALRGYHGSPLLGKTVHWTRTTLPSRNEEQ